jgi:CheY-like chemotaxis protein
MHNTTGQGTILCVDDEESQLVLRKSMLERAGYRVLTANSPTKAIELFRAEAIDLIIIDYFMPGMNGLALAQQLLRQKKVPVVMLSAYTELPGESIGVANTWITKGNASAKLLTAVAELLHEA